MSNSSSATDRLLATALTGVTSGPSLLITSLCCWALLKRKAISNKQYAWLSVSLAIADGGVLAVFFFWTVPVSIFGQEDVGSLVGRKMGQLSLTFVFAVLYNMLLLAMNRFTGVVFFRKYQVWFSPRKTKLLIALVWLVSVSHGMLYFYPSCDFVYDHDWFYWIFVVGPCYDLMIALDLWFSLGCLAIIFALNFFAGLSLLHANRHITSSKSDEKRRRRQEAKFFLQTCLNVAVSAFMYVSFHLISPHAATTMEIYMTTTWIWQASHATNGWILFLLNKDVRKHVMALLLCRPSAAATTVHPTGSHHTSHHHHGRTEKTEHE